MASEIPPVERAPRNQVQRTRFPCMETEFNEVGFYVGKPSSTNSVSIHGNRVHWTLFLYMETEFVELDFHVFSTSVFLTQVHWTRIVINEISLKRLLTNDIVWVL